MRKQAKQVTLLLICFFVMPVFGQSAPVYDIESLQPESYETQEAKGDDSLVTIVPSNQVAESISEGQALNENQRINRLEQQLANLSANDNAMRLESLQTQVQALRDQVEQLTHDLTQIQKQKITPNIQAEKHLAEAKTQPIKDVAELINDVPIDTVVPVKQEKIAKKTATGTIEKIEVHASGIQQDEDEEQQIYESAYTLIKTKKYTEAIEVLQKMLKKYPKGQFASNAHYWLGELFGLEGNTQKALDQFIIIVKNYPKSPRISDAQLKVGLILASQTKWAEAKAELKKVLAQYPGTASAKIASEQLKQIKHAGH